MELKLKRIKELIHKNNIDLVLSGVTCIDLISIDEIALGWQKRQLNGMSTYTYIDEVYKLVSVNYLKGNLEYDNYKQIIKNFTNSIYDSISIDDVYEISINTLKETGYK